MKLPDRIDWSKIKKEYIIIAIVLGAVLMLFAKTGSDDSAALGEEKTYDSSFFDINTEDSSEAEISAYLSYIKASLLRCLGQMKGVGKAEVFLTVEASTDNIYSNGKVPAVQGVLIVAEGADDPLIVKDITEACEALFSISVHKIKVVKMKEESK